jgi:EAL domain-containing protein (putative c-di-GMP-specific phosphodiesterase class I)/ketosteroid isomerase-like protein
MIDEDGAIIAPGEFLPAAERFGLISEIDRWVIRQAAAVAATGTPAEFNLSARSLSDPLVLRELAAAIADSGVDPSLLVVEVTETAFAGHPDVGRTFAEHVTELGCQLALDDFGTGFSSLSYLKHLPADHLKIDMEFVRDLVRSETDMRVVRGIVGLAREFNQTTIAEGVEDEETLVLLRELGVDMAQGYLLGRPVPWGELPPTHGPAAPAHDPGGRPGAPDPIVTVHDAFAAFARRDIGAMLALCHPEIVLRAFATSRLADHPEPYRGRDGLRTYLADVDRVWDELSFTPLTFRAAGGSVIGFGRAEGRRGPVSTIASIMWIVRLRDGQISALEVFQAVGGTPSMSPGQLARLTATPALA